MSKLRSVSAGFSRRRRPISLGPPSYMIHAWFTWFRYLFFWLPGVVANLWFLSEARAIHRQTRIEPSGTGCLWALLWMNLIIPAILIAAVVFGVVSLAGLSAVVR